MACKKTYSLLELSVVITIIALLASAGFVSFYRAILHQEEKKAQESLQAIEEAEWDYYNYNGRFSKDFTPLDIKDPSDKYYKYQIYILPDLQGYVKAKHLRPGLRDFCWDIPTRKMIACPN